MAAIPDVSELFIRVGDLTRRSDMAALWKSVLQLAEDRMWRTLRCAPMEKTATLEPDENGIVALPADFLELRHVENMTGMSLHAVNARYDRSGGNGRGYAIVGNTLVMRPTGGAVEATYYARPPSLVDNATNDMLAAYPDLYLFGVAREVALHARDPELVGMIDPLFTQALQAVELQDLSQRFGMQAVRLTGPTP